MTRPGQNTRHGDENAVAKHKHSTHQTGPRVVLGDVSNARSVAARAQSHAPPADPAFAPSTSSAIPVAMRRPHEAGGSAAVSVAPQDHSPPRALKRAAETSLDVPEFKRDRVLVEDETVHTVSSPGLIDPAGSEMDADLDSEFAETETAPYMLPSDRPRFAGVQQLARVAVPHADLDSEDADDPFMAPEYAQDIFELLYRTEPRYVALPTYMTEVQNMRWAVRGVLMNWLITVHAKFRLLPETLMLATNIVDRFLSLRKTPLAQIQLVGVTSLFIAAKYEEVYSPGISNYAYVSNCESAEICHKEREILSCLEYDLSAPNPLHFLRLVSKADDYNIRTRTFAKYLTEILLVNERLLPFAPSALTAGAVCVARDILGQGPWDNNLIHYGGGYTRDALQPVMQVIVEFLMAPVVHQDFEKKYASKKFLRASVISRQWAESHGRQWLAANGVFAR